ncbi:MAG: helix-turn-helix transcriptional regulator [Melioribacteraceae bacterium]|nr:helix-turn-helix transcriptional regulator [Melioribacteraceae bacterium]
MVCNRCIKAVREELQKLGINIRAIELGEVETDTKIDKNISAKIKSVLEENGFELIEDKRAKIIEKLKNYIIKFIHHSDGNTDHEINYSELISREMNLEYHYLSGLFSSMEGITIEHYIILQKIERAKELLKYDELTLSEIAYKLGYSSVAHLSSQFKKVTGMTASQFKSITTNERKPLDEVK